MPPLPPLTRKLSPASRRKMISWLIVGGVEQVNSASWSAKKQFGSLRIAFLGFCRRPNPLTNDVPMRQILSPRNSLSSPQQNVTRTRATCRGQIWSFFCRNVSCRFPHLTTPLCGIWAATLSTLPRFLVAEKCCAHPFTNHSYLVENLTRGIALLFLSLLEFRWRKSTKIPKAVVKQ